MASSLAGERASRASEKPIALSLRRFSASFGRPCSRMRASMATIASIWARNQGSILQIACTSSAVMPSRMAWATIRSRSGVGVPMAADGVLVVAFAEARDLDLVEAGQPGLQARAAPSAGFRQRCGRWP
jgi:hypothetical protein